MQSPIETLAAVHEKIVTAAKKSGRNADEIELVAVSKTHPPETVQEIADAGQIIFGESRVQEARAKIPLLPGRLQWHFIGHLQKNKIRVALPLFQLFHSIDSLELAKQFQRIAEEDGQRPRVLLEVNVAGEASKFGFSTTAIQSQMEEILALDRLDVVGLMGIAPLAPEAENSRPYFEQLRGLRDHLQNEGGIGLPHLSMGMSGDYLVAIEEGATLVRVGSAIFGTRSGKKWSREGEVE